MRVLETEDRVCNQCGAEYVWTIRNRFGLCKPCRERRNKTINNLKPEERKKKYPLDHNARNRRYRRLQSELNKTYDRAEWKKIFHREWETITTTGIFEWCTDLRTVVILRKGAGRIGPLPKNQTDMNEKWPSTKDWYE